jgi:hypothetical protein
MFDPAKQPMDGTVRHQTLLQFTKAADALGAHERMAFGLYKPDGEKPYEYRHLSKLHAVEMQQKLTEKLKFKSTIQGTIHNLGVEEHYFQLRERKSGLLIRCDFPAKLYDEVHFAASNPNGLVYVRGTVSQRRVDRFVEGMKAERIKAAPPAPNVFSSLFGRFPDYTGDLNTQQFVDQAWDTSH